MSDTDNSRLIAARLLAVGIERRKQRRIKSLDAHYNRAMGRLQKWTEQRESLTGKIVAVTKDIAALERELEELTKEINA